MTLEKVLKELTPTIEYFAYKYGSINTLLSSEDMKSIGIIAVMETFPRWDNSKNVCLNTFFRPRIRGSMLESLRQVKGRTGRLNKEHLNFEDFQTPLGEGSIEDALFGGDSRKDNFKLLNQKKLFELLDTFSKRDRDIFIQYISRSRSMKKIGESFNLTESSICQIINRMKSKLTFKVSGEVF